MECESSDDFFEDSGSDWTPLNEIEYDSILAFDSDEENVPPIEKNHESDLPDVNIIPATSSSSDLEEVNTPTRKRKRFTKKMEEKCHEYK
ncbi:unnamed protein product [Macrosiphum euphorbiae]|uniref:Uncharacterized protein n=1 Tax=Macrosiphum euphorbiae TaxID=13131 RepID=A0AAV0XWQ9_9HEMI|nr:unnamed protein product [Macrosiphum euphorbiae]